MLDGDQQKQDIFLNHEDIGTNFMGVISIKKYILC